MIEKSLMPVHIRLLRANDATIVQTEHPGAYQIRNGFSKYTLTSVRLTTKTG